MSCGSVVVIGAGVIGAACALRLQERGFDVTLLDHDQPGQGASFGNASVIAATEVVPIASPGLIRNLPKLLINPEGPLFVAPGYLPRMLPWVLRFLRNSTLARTERNAASLASLCRNAVADTRAWLDGLGLQQDMAQTPSLRLYPTRAGLEADAYKLDLRRRLGVEMEVIDAQEIRRLEPSIRGNYEAGVLTQGAHFLRDPLRPITRSVKKLCQIGGHFRVERVSHLQPGESAPSVILSSGERLDADHVVLAAGIRSAHLARGLGACFPLESERGYHVQYTGLALGLSRGLVDTARGFAVSPVDGGLRVAGLVEFRGVDAPLDQRRTETLKRHARHMFGDVLDKRETTIWLGHRPSLPDGLPVIGAAAGQNGLFYAFGHGHLGLTLAATTARMVSDMMSGAPPQANPTPFRANRF